VEECTYFWGVNTSWGINTAESKDLCIRKIIRLHNQQVIDQMKDDPDLIGMIGAPTDNPYESRVGLSGPELIEIDEITGSDNPEITTPQAESPGDVSAQLEIVGISGRTSAPNPLHELINIYDDE
jgi:hypothetical protein